MITAHASLFNINWFEFLGNDDLHCPGGFMPPRGSLEESIAYAGYRVPNLDWDGVYQNIAQDSMAYNEHVQ